MKTIYLVRHAKAGSSHSGDFDRKLNETGLKEAHVMGELLKERGVAADMVIASPAKRALTTAEIFCDILGYQKLHIEKRMEIYEGGAGNLVKIVEQITDSCNSAMLFGHNPGITECANRLAGSSINSMATCGVVRLDFDSEGWSALHEGCCKLVWYEFPKQQW